MLVLLGLAGSMCEVFYHLLVELLHGLLRERILIYLLILTEAIKDTVLNTGVKLVNFVILAQAVLPTVFVCLCQVIVHVIVQICAALSVGGVVETWTDEALNATLVVDLHDPVREKLAIIVGLVLVERVEQLRLVLVFLCATLVEHRSHGVLVLALHSRESCLLTPVVVILIRLSCSH